MSDEYILPSRLEDYIDIFCFVGAVGAAHFVDSFTLGIGLILGFVLLNRVALRAME